MGVRPAAQNLPEFASMRFVKTVPFILIVALVVILTVSVVRNRQKPNRSFLSGSTMGTSYSITINDRLHQAKLHKIEIAVTERLLDIDYEMSSWNPESRISQFNKFHPSEAREAPLSRGNDLRERQSSERFPVSPELASVVRRALKIAELTGGAFDPTVKPLVDHWGFGPEADTEPLDKIMKAVGWEKVVLTGNDLSKKEENVQLDLSAIAKGYGVDSVAEVIRSFGVKNFLVEIGGEVRVSGSKSGGKPWRVGIESPNGTEVFQTLELRGGAMATSGDYRNFRTRADGSRFSHIINPETGRPAETDVASVSVLADSCMDADAVATALFVMGAEAGIAQIEKQDRFEAFFILHSTNGTFTSRATGGFPE